MDVPRWGVRQPSNAPALVKREVFDKVQALLDGKRPTIVPRMRRHPDFPLRHFVRCALCDRPLTASWSKGRSQRYAYYRCQNRSCRAVNVRREAMERLFVEFLAHLQPKSQYLRLFGEDPHRGLETETSAGRCEARVRTAPASMRSKNANSPSLTRSCISAPLTERRTKSNSTS